VTLGASVTPASPAQHRPSRRPEGAAVGPGLGHRWPGVNGLTALLGGHTLHATRPRHFFRRTGRLPAAVTLTLALPRELGEPAPLLDELQTQHGNRKI